MLRMIIYNTSTLNKYRSRKSEDIATEKKQQQVLTNEIIYWVRGGIELNYIYLVLLMTFKQGTTL